MECRLEREESTRIPLRRSLSETCQFYFLHSGRITWGPVYRADCSRLQIKHADCPVNVKNPVGMSESGCCVRTVESRGWLSEDCGHVAAAASWSGDSFNQVNWLPGITSRPQRFTVLRGNICTIPLTQLARGYCFYILRFPLSHFDQRPFFIVDFPLNVFHTMSHICITQ